jgi:pimeloyl-ACP methyl ester carboxylesterase
MRWVLFRGLVREIRHWGDFPNTLEQLDEVDSVHCIEMPGVGKKSQIQAPLRISQYTDQMREEFLQLTREFPNTKWGVIAVSMGGMIAMDWCDRFPEDFSKVVLINSSAGNLTPFYKRLKIKTLKNILPFVIKPNVAKREETILRLTTNMIDITRKLIEQRVIINRDAPLTRNTFIRQISAAAKFKVKKALQVPTLILNSADDNLVHPASSYALAKYHKAPIKIHYQAGHDLCLDDPKWVLKQIAEFK